MRDAIEGRWWLDFTRQPPLHSAGNEFILSNGLVTIAHTGAPSGNYEVGPGALTMFLPLPSIEGEPSWRMQVTLVLPDPENPAALLPGIIEAFDSTDEAMMREACSLVRRRANA